MGRNNTQTSEDFADEPEDESAQIRPKEFHGYQHAASIDEIISDLHSTYPMTEDNVNEWFKFARTLETTFDLLTIECNRVAGLSQQETGDE